MPETTTIKVLAAEDRKTFTLNFRNGPAAAGRTKTDLPPGTYKLTLRGANARGQDFTVGRTETIENGVVRHRGGTETIDFAVIVAPTRRTSKAPAAPKRS